MKAYFDGTPIAMGGSGGTGGIPTGVIVIWSGAADNVPDGWHICDGTDGTPDLRGRFVLGSSEEYAVGATGGEKKVTLNLDNIPNHTHSVRVTNTSGSIYGAYIPINIKSGTSNGNGLSTESSGGGDIPQPVNNLPPYYALCYIMKV